MQCTPQTHCPVPPTHQACSKPDRWSGTHPEDASALPPTIFDSNSIVDTCWRSCTPTHGLWEELQPPHAAPNGVVAQLLASRLDHMPRLAASSSASTMDWLQQPLLHVRPTHQPILPTQPAPAPATASTAAAPQSPLAELDEGCAPEQLSMHWDVWVQDEALAERASSTEHLTSSIPQSIARKVALYDTLTTQHDVGPAVLIVLPEPDVEVWRTSSQHSLPHAHKLFGSRQRPGASSSSTATMRLVDTLAGHEGSLHSANAYDGARLSLSLPALWTTATLRRLVHQRRRLGGVAHMAHARDKDTATPLLGAAHLDRHSASATSSVCLPLVTCSFAAVLDAALATARRRATGTAAQHVQLEQSSTVAASSAHVDVPPVASTPPQTARFAATKVPLHLVPKIHCAYCFETRATCHRGLMLVAQQLRLRFLQPS